MPAYIESKLHGKVRPEIMEHYKASVEKNRALNKLLAG
jgi:hypothetical protein